MHCAELISTKSTQPVGNISHPEYYNENLQAIYEGWNFNSGNYLFTTDTK